MIIHPLILGLIFLCIPPSAQQEDSLQEAPAAQEGERPRVRSGLGKRGKSAALHASDGKLVKPGRIPEDTKDDARELWALILRGTHSTTASPDPVDSFRMSFDMTARHEGGVNDVRLDLAYRMSEGYLRTDILRSNRTQMRGPDGDFLIEEEEVTNLAGRENVQSRRDMDQWIAIARNFLSLTDPGSIRIVSMREVGAPTDRLPAEVRAKSSGLRWLEVESPDFRLYSTDGAEKTPIFKALLAVRPHTAHVEFSLIQKSTSRGDGEARLFAHKKFKEIEGYSLPHNVRVYLVDVLDPGLNFFARPSIELFLRKNGELNPELAVDLFRP